MVESKLEQATTQWRNLAPSLVRQRVVIEGLTERIVEPREMKDYLVALAKVADMEILSGPYAYSAHELGYGGWVHWRTSGTHIYSYPTNPPLFTVDMYTCKPFKPQEAVNFTNEYFKALEIVWKEIES